MNKFFKYFKSYLFYYFYLLISRKKNENCGVEGIIFSMDRPMQLYSLLESFYCYCENPPKLNLLIKYTKTEFQDEYKNIEIIFKNKNIDFFYETDFKENLITIIAKISKSNIFFLVDDIIFKDKFNFNHYFQIKNFNNYIFSLRLGKNLNYCYPRSISQFLPKFTSVNNLNSWKWFSYLNNGDWGYIFSVDGNVYSKRQVEIMTKIINFKAPNSFESNMNIFRYIFLNKKGLCYNQSILVNVSLGRVNQEIENISGNISVIKLLEQWKLGYKIDINIFHKIDNKSAHIETNEPLFIMREQKYY